MKRCFILSGLLLNFIGVVFLFFGLSAEKAGPSCSSYDEKGNVKCSYFVSQHPVLLNIGLAFICFGIALQMIGTY